MVAILEGEIVRMTWWKTTFVAQHFLMAWGFTSMNHCPVISLCEEAISFRSYEQVTVHFKHLTIIPSRAFDHGSSRSPSQEQLELFQCGLLCVIMDFLEELRVFSVDWYQLFRIDSLNHFANLLPVGMSRTMKMMLL
jgi:hypothetical protein